MTLEKIIIYWEWGLVAGFFCNFAGHRSCGTWRTDGMVRDAEKRITRRDFTKRRQIKPPEKTWLLFKHSLRPCVINKCRKCNFLFYAKICNSNPPQIFNTDLLTTDLAIVSLPPTLGNKVYIYILRGSQS